MFQPVVEEMIQKIFGSEVQLPIFATRFENTTSEMTSEAKLGSVKFFVEGIEK
jgi:hypothetical protein